MSPCRGGAALFMLNLENELLAEGRRFERANVVWTATVRELIQREEFEARTMILQAILEVRVY
jgi:hypothetical protein